MIPVHVALVDDTGSLNPQDMAEVAGALSEQVQHDFAPVWHVSASVGVYRKAPPHTWSIHVLRSLDMADALGYHTDDHNQPVARIALTDDWPATCSHELLEMLADPWGNRLHGARLPVGLEDDHARFGLAHPSSRVHYLLEVSDPCEATSYEVGGVQLSDFLMPAWYRTTPLSLPAYSRAAGCKEPREVAVGGYVSFAVGNAWWQVYNNDGRLEVQSLGTFDRQRYGSLRTFTDTHSALYGFKYRPAPPGRP